MELKVRLPPKANSSNSSNSRLIELMAKAKEQLKVQDSVAPSELVTISPPKIIKGDSKSSKAIAPSKSSEAVSGELILNSEQDEFVETATVRENCILIGAAGTGKTTCMKATIEALIRSNVRTLTGEHKTLKEGLPAIICCAFTNRAVNNLAKNIPTDLRQNCLTIHKLLEYAPVYFDVEDEESGKIKRTMEFLPSRDASNPLSPSIEAIIIEEASMVSVELFEKLKDALSHRVQIILLGDIQQLPPVFGSAILGFKMLEWRLIELTQVYRQALNSPIIRLAHRVLSGRPIMQAELIRDYENKAGNDLKVILWDKPYTPDQATLHAFRFIKAAYDSGKYVPEEHTILIPYNKSFGTLEFNLMLANHIARKNHRTTYEIVAGFTSKFISIGDYVLQDKREATILSIEKNPNYSGKEYKLESETLDYWGHDPEALATATSKLSDIDIDSFLDAMSAEGEEAKMQVSHCITVQYQDTDEIKKLESIGEIQGIIFAYAITVHKSQGSEWKKVFLFLHKSHAAMLQRELLYTAITRARKELVIVCEKDTFVKGIIAQKIKGNTLAEKAEYFKGKLESNGGKVGAPKKLPKF